MRLRNAPPRGDAPGLMAAPLTPTSGDELTLRRDDLAALVAAYRLHHSRPKQWLGVVVGIGSLVLAATLIRFGAYRHWSPTLGPIFFFGGWAGLLGSLAFVRRQGGRLRHRFQMDCPACKRPLVDGTLDRPGVARAELAISTGNCPHCGAHILDG